jgi:thioesterase domain-containing protein
MSSPDNDLNNVSAVLKEANRRGIILFLEKAKLKYKTSNKDHLDDHFIGQLKKFKNELEILLSDHSNDNEAGYSSIRPLNNCYNKPAIFILPGTPGFCEAYKDLANAFEDTYAVYGVQMIGLQEGEEPLYSLTDTARLTKKWIRQVQPAGPYRFIGHSLGAYIAFEMSRELEQNGEAVEFISILDASVHLTSSLRSKTGKTIDDGIVGTTRFFLTRYNLVTSPYPDWIDNLRSEMALLPTDQKISFVLNCVRDKIDAKENAAFMLRTLYVMLIHSLMVYSPAGRIQSKLLIVKAGEENWSGYDEYLGWKDHADEIEAIVVPGDHLTIVNSANAFSLMEKIKAHLQSN